MVFKMAENQALQRWLDQRAELKVKESVENGERCGNINVAVIRSLNREESSMKIKLQNWAI